MCILLRIMCLCCKNGTGKAKSENIGPIQGIQSQRVPPVSQPPRLSHERPNVPSRFTPTPAQVHQPSAPQISTLHDEGVESPIDHQQYCSQKEYKIPNSSPTPLQRLPKLGDYEDSEDLKSLTVKQLKILLTLNRVDFKGCIEKFELLEKVERLWEDKNQHKDLSEDTPIDQLCKLCMDAPLDCVLLECGHIASCVDCGKRLAECPICRQYVVRVVRTFKA